MRAVTLRHCNPKIEPAIFSLEPRQFTFVASMPQPKILGFDAGIRKVKMKAFQLPVVSNTATTGHKLQGASLDRLFVHDWNYSCRNWAYVVLSRVRTMAGLTFRKPLTVDRKKFNITADYVDFVHQMKKKSPTFYTDDLSSDKIKDLFHPPPPPPPPQPNQTPTVST